MISVALSPAGFAPHLLQLTQEYLGIQSGFYTYMPSLRQLDHSPSLQPPGIDWPPYISPIRVAPFAFYLRGHPDQEFAAFWPWGSMSDTWHKGRDYSHLQGTIHHHWPILRWSRAIFGVKCWPVEWWVLSHRGLCKQSTAVWLVWCLKLEGVASGE